MKHLHSHSRDIFRGLLAMSFCWMVAGCGKSSEQKRVAPSVEMATPAPARENETNKASIGSATMEQDGTLVLNLRAEGSGAIGDGRLVYRPGDKDYQAILAHVGPIEKGQTVPVKPWPGTK